MSIERLRNIVAPPPAPTEVPTAEHWAALEARLGLPLPRDFHEFLATYGSGYLGSFLWIYNPASENRFSNFTACFDQTLGFLREIRDAEPELGIVVFPDKDGWLPFGATDNGDYLMWRTAGPADEWTVVVMPARDPELEHFPMSLTAFLASIYDESLKTSLFPEDVPGGDFSFVPFRSLS